MNILGSLFIISAPSGTGKTSLVSALLRAIPSLKKSVSHTTRERRSNEEDGKHYHFVTAEKFKEMVSKNAFLEHAEVFGNLYGTSAEWVENRLQVGEDVILEIDWQGAQQLRKKVPQAVTIFILPPSANALAERLKLRNLDDPSTIANRLAQAKVEVRHYNEYEYLIVNDDFERTLEDLQHIVRAARLRTTQQQATQKTLIDELCKKA